MTENILEVHNLSKDYGDFVLDKLSFLIPRGVIMGLIGENGAGKSTTINCILNEITMTDGGITIFGKNNILEEVFIKNKIGIIFDENHFPDILTPIELGKCMAGIYSSWQSREYQNYLTQFELPREKKIKDFSRGMKVKLAFAVALAHKAELLILDETTVAIVDFFIIPTYSGRSPNRIADIVVTACASMFPKLNVTKSKHFAARKIVAYWKIFDSTWNVKLMQHIKMSFIMGKRISTETRQDILIQAFLTCPNVTEVSKKTGIPRSTIYGISKKEGFQERLAEARQTAVNDAVAYLQGNLSECAEVLMDIVRDKEAQPQVRINAVNSVFAGVPCL